MDLIDAAKNGNLETVLTLLECGFAANTRDNDNATALYWSACHGHSDVTEIVISAGCDVNATVRWGSTALHAAADRGQAACVQILLNSGASPNCTNSRGDTPLHIASYRGFVEIIRMLLLAGSDVNLKNEKGKIPQQEALEGGNSDIAECIRVFVTEGHFSIPTDSQNHAVTMRNNNNIRNRPSSYHTPLTNFTTYRNTRDVTDSMTSSWLTCGSRFPGDHVDGSALIDWRCNPGGAGLRRSVSFGGSTHLNHLYASPPHPLPVSRSTVTETSATESVDYSNTATNGSPSVTDSSYTIPAVSRPIRSMRENVVSPDKDEAIALLQNQLVDSYKHADILTKENEHLKFKSSTLLERLTETEKMLSEVTKKCEHLTGQLEGRNRNRTTNGPNTGMEPAGSPYDMIVNPTGISDGLEELAKRFLDTPDALSERVEETVENLTQRYLYSSDTRHSNQDAEWLPGVDYVILGDPPISAPINEKLPNFVSFMVKHLKTNKCFILKMLIKLEPSLTNLSTKNHPKQKDTSPTYTKLQSIPYLLKALRQFEAPTDRLRKFVCIPPPSRGSGLPQQTLASRTTFIVTPYMLTLRKLIDMCYDGHLGSFDGRVNTVFWVHVLYQLSSVLCLLEEQGRHCGEIDENTVGFDDELIPYLKNIENVIGLETCCSKAGSVVDLSTSNEFAKEIRAMSVYCDTKSETRRSDVTKLCKLFYEVLFDTNTGNVPLISDMRQTESSIVKGLYRILVDAKETTSVLFNDRNTAGHVMKRLGFLLYGPGRCTVTSESDCHVYRHTHLLHLVTDIPNFKRRAHEEDTCLSIEDSVHQNNVRIKAHYLRHVTPHELWTLHKLFENCGLFIR